MAARYNYFSGEDADGINSSNPNLEIVNNGTSWEDTGYTSSTSATGKMGILQDLLEWNKLDPVDEFEIHRNNLLFRNYSFNRNPFVDFPEWADYIWGTCKDGSYDTTLKGSANPQSDKINGDTEAVTPDVPSDPDTPATPDNPSGEEKKGLDTKTIIIIAVVAGVVLIVAIIIFASLSKRNKKKVLKTVKKTVKKSSKSSKKK